jgi:CNP1-like family
LLLVLALAGCASAKVGENDWVLPPYPAKATLVEFSVAEAPAFRFFIDAASLAPGTDGVVRYVLVARSPEGVENVSFEGIRCASAQYRIYAVGRNDGTWAGRPADWHDISGATIARWRTALQREYFCPQNQPIASREEGVLALRQGGHPFSRSLGAESFRR